MTGTVTSAFGGSGNISTVANINSLDDLASYTALFLDLGELDNALSATEQATLGAFVASGRRVFFLGENNAWANWHNSFLAVTGGTVGPNLFGFSMTSLGSHAITNGVSTVNMLAAGSASGGIQLFSDDVMQIRGAQQNVFSTFDLNAFSNDLWGQADNARLGQNVASWLAATPGVVVPEPSSVALLGTGLLLLGTVRRRRSRTAI